MRWRHGCGVYGGLPAASGIDPVAAMRGVAQGNARAARDAGLPGARIDEWLRGELAAVERIGAWLSARAAAGFVRRAHGDLHLGNLCLWQGVPVPFDAIEFDEAMATIDLGYDLAFLLMDLDHRVTRGAANRVLNRYVARTGDATLTSGLPVFLSLRAMIRAQVEASRGNRDMGRHIWTGRSLISRPGRRWWWRSVGCRGPGNPPWRGRWRLGWVPRRARWCCAATRSASANTAWRPSSGWGKAPIARPPATRCSPSWGLGGRCGCRRTCRDRRRHVSATGPARRD